MDITFRCPNCDQELEVDSSGGGTTIECPACSNSIVVPVTEAAEPVVVTAADVAPQPAAVAEEKHFTVPVHATAPAALIQKPNVPLEIAAKIGDKTLRLKTIKHSECQDSGKDNFDKIVSAFLEKVGQENVVSVRPVNYSYTDMGSRAILTDYGVMILFKG